MRRSKDEGLKMGPMFPRLHVNDTEKGGPRAPPRNKMALYEQLSIASQRFNHAALPYNPTSAGANLVPHSSQSSGEERVMFSSHQRHLRLISEKQYSQYSDVSSPLMQFDDFSVPTFVHARTIQDLGKNAHNVEGKKVCPVDASYFNQSFEHSISIGRAVTGHTPRQGQTEMEEGQNELFKTVSTSSVVENTGCLDEPTSLSSSRDLGNDRSNRVISLKIDDRERCAESESAGGDQSTAALGERSSALNKRVTSSRSFPSRNPNIVRAVAIETDSCEDGLCGPLQMGTLVRGDGKSILNGVSGLDIKPDDIVGMIGEKHFWEARRAITNQQRVFAFQVFELHRLVKVQKGITLSHLLEDVASVDKSMIATLKHPDNTPKALSNPCNQNSFGKPAVPFVQTDLLPSSHKPSNGSLCSDKTPRPPGFTLPQAQQQWLIPVMSPSEGLVYKPYPSPSFTSPVFGSYGQHGPNQMAGNFSFPACGMPIQQPQYQLPSFPFPAVNAYFPSYGMPMMGGSFAKLSAEQTNPPIKLTKLSAEELNFSIQDPSDLSQPRQNGAAVPAVNLHAYVDIEVQGSTSSSPNERPQEIVSVKARNVLPLFPTSPPSDSFLSCGPQSEHPPLPVIKVVPHHSKSATEFAARIFRSILEERNQYGSV